MVESDVPRVTLCLRTGSSSLQQASSAAKVARAAGRGQAAALLAPASNAVAGSACGCEGSGDIEAMSSSPDSGELSMQSIVTPLSSSSDSGSGSMSSRVEAGGSGGSCEYQAWLLPLQAGQNVFNITLPVEVEQQQQQQRQQMLVKLPLVSPRQQPTSQSAACCSFVQHPLSAAAHTFPVVVCWPFAACRPTTAAGTAAAAQSSTHWRWCG
jgi:hypothetical protein